MTMISSLEYSTPPRPGSVKKEEILSDATPATDDDTDSSTSYMEEDEINNIVTQVLADADIDGMVPPQVLEAQAQTKAPPERVIKISFGKVTVHEHPIILGDHPAVSKGCPLTVAWNASESNSTDLEFYEFYRGPTRPRKKLILSQTRRSHILMAAGYSLDDLVDVAMQIEKIKKQRAESAANAKLDGIASRLGLANVNLLTDLMSGAAESTGGTLRLMAKGTGDLVAGTSKVATDVVVGTGKLGFDVVAGTGRGITNAVKSTGRSLSRMMSNDDCSMDQSIASTPGSDGGREKPRRRRSGTFLVGVASAAQRLTSASGYSDGSSDEFSVDSSPSKSHRRRRSGTFLIGSSFSDELKSMDESLGHRQQPFEVSPTKSEGGKAPRRRSGSFLTGVTNTIRRVSSNSKLSDLSSSPNSHSDLSSPPSGRKPLRRRLSGNLSLLGRRRGSGNAALVTFSDDNEDDNDKPTISTSATSRRNNVRRTTSTDGCPSRRGGPRRALKKTVSSEDAKPPHKRKSEPADGFQQMQAFLIKLETREYNPDRVKDILADQYCSNANDRRKSWGGPKGERAAEVDSDSDSDDSESEVVEC